MFTHTNNKTSRPYYGGLVALTVMLLLNIDVIANNTPDALGSIPGTRQNPLIDFRDMVYMGMTYIKENTDHLFFLLALLLPAPLLSNRMEWGEFAGFRLAINRMLKIIIAYLAGHVITLLIGTIGLFHFNVIYAEVLIAAGITIAGLHALRPILSGKEIYFAAVFGLVHGIVFADSLVQVNLGSENGIWQMLGFNLGMEFMQLLIISVTIPWLLVLSYNNTFTVFRVTGAIVFTVAALSWIVEQISGTANMAIEIAKGMAAYPWVVMLALILSAIFSFLFSGKSTKCRESGQK
jgi:hypothetical protein